MAGRQLTLDLFSNVEILLRRRSHYDATSLRAVSWMMLRNHQLAEDFSFVVDGDVGV
jgi:hypothetical protein